MAASATSGSGTGRPAHGAAGARAEARLVTLWSGILLPPISWLIDFVARTTLGRWINVHAVRWPLRVITCGCLALLILGVILCARANRQARAALVERARGQGAGADEMIDQDLVNHATLASWGIAIAVLFFLLLLAQSFPVFVLDPREIT